MIVWLVSDSVLCMLFCVVCVSRCSVCGLNVICFLLRICLRCDMMCLVGICFRLNCR